MIGGGRGGLEDLRKGQIVYCAESVLIYQTKAVQCFAGYYDIKYGNLLDGEKQKGVIINTPIRNTIITINTEHHCSAK